MKSRIAIILLAWLAFMVIAVASGVLREGVLTPALGEHTAHQIGTVFVCVLIAFAIVHAIRRLRPTPVQALGVGAAWAVMTIAFEFGVFHCLVGHPMRVLLADYNLVAGRLWPLVLLTELLMPWWVARSARTDKPGASRPVRSEHTLAGAAADQRSRNDKKRRGSVPVLPAEFRRTITKEEIADLPMRCYTGEVCVVNSAAA